MKKIVLGILIATVAVPALAQEAASAGVKVSVSQALFDADGRRVGNVYRVAADGSAQLIIDEGRLVTVPVSTLSEADGKLKTSLTKKQITSRR